MSDFSINAAHQSLAAWDLGRNKDYYPADAMDEESCFYNKMFKKPPWGEGGNTRGEGCSKSLEAIEKAFSSAVEKRLNDRLRQSPPKKGQEGAAGGFQERLAEARKNGNTRSAILIKQEAAEKGIILN